MSEKDLVLKNKLIDFCLENLEDDDYCNIQDSVSELIGINISTKEAKEVFKLLDMNIICDGLKWDFSDTEVRHDIHSFIERNSLKIKEALLSD